MNRIIGQCCWVLVMCCLVSGPAKSAHWANAHLEATSSRVVKLYGAGGVSGIEGYQTGLLVADSKSLSTGQLVLTVDGVLLESGEAIVVLSSGDRYTGRVVGIDSLTNVAVLRIETEESLVAAFDLDRAVPVPMPGDRIRVFSNAFNIAVGDEPVSLQQGGVAAMAPLPKAPLGRTRRAPPLLAASPVLLVDCVTSNPGTAGGAVVDGDGQLLGMVGKELRNAESGTWMNYALPTPLLREALARAIIPSTDSVAGISVATPPSLTLPSSTLPQLVKYGIHLIPAISARTPAYVEQVRAGSPAANSGLQRDDWIVLVGGRSVTSTADAQQAIFASLSREGRVRLTVLRGEELIPIELSARGTNENQ